jgi:4-hydroxyacetophenone monooxygenase
MTGDLSLLDGPIRPQKMMPGASDGGLCDSDKTIVRKKALEALRDYVDRGGTMPKQPSRSTIRRMMSFAVGDDVPDEYVPMFLEEMALDSGDARDVAWDGVPVSRRTSFKVVIIGAGMSGLLAAVRFKQAGIPFVVLEKNCAVGGTWLENTYPGCRVDVANHFYCYSFAPNHDWPEFFSRRNELRDYFERCADEFGVRAHIRFDTEVLGAWWNESAACWHVRIRSDAGEQTLVANAVISAVGQLNRPRLPQIPGRDAFAGPSFHSAQWQHEHDLTGKRVAVIGTGASAFQLCPEVAKVAGRLLIFQRTPPWMAPNPRYHARVSTAKKWLLRYVPYYARWYRFLLFWPGSDGLMPALEVDPEWPHPERSVNAANDATREFLTQYITSQVGEDSALLGNVMPTYPPFGKRMLQDNGTWLATLKRENVDLVTTPIAAITPHSVRCADGVDYPVDVIVYATGFQATRFLWPMEIVGRDGVTLSDRWGEEPRAYLGITVPGFPNFFCLYGPGTNLAHAGSIIFHSECQVHYVMGCLTALLSGNHSSMDCRQDVHDEYAARFDARHARLVWSHPGMNSWYKNAHGKVLTTSPWRLVDYWRWTRTPTMTDYHMR